MNPIAAKIDQATDALKALNDLMDAQRQHDLAYHSGNVQAIIDATVRLHHAKMRHWEMSGPVEFVAPDMTVEPLPDCGETFNEPRKSYAMHADDPRRGQSSGINSMIRRVE